MKLFRMHEDILIDAVQLNIVGQSFLHSRPAVILIEHYLKGLDTIGKHSQ